MDDYIHKPEEAVDDWKTALRYLEAGNKRYLKNRMLARDTYEQDRASLKSGQKPFAVVVTCSDSRVPPELFFDQKLGDIFVIRSAGNTADKAALGSIEYAVLHLHVPLVVVVGHSSCGAVTGAMQDGKHPENLQSIMDAIHPALKETMSLG